MAKNQLLAAVILVGAIAAIGVYRWRIYAGLSWWAFFMVATLAVVGTMGIIAWIGWTLATTPTPEPIEPLKEASSEADTTENKKDSSALISTITISFYYFRIYWL